MPRHKPVKVFAICVWGNGTIKQLYYQQQYKYPGLQIIEGDSKLLFLILNKNIWAKIWQKGPSGNKGQKWDIYRKRKT